MDSTPLGPSQNLEEEGGKVVGHTWYYRIDRLVDESAKKLADMKVEYGAKSAGDKASQDAEVPPRVVVAPESAATPKHSGSEFPKIGWTKAQVDAAVRLDIEEFRDTLSDARCGNAKARKAIKNSFSAIRRQRGSRRPEKQVPSLIRKCRAAQLGF